MQQIETWLKKYRAACRVIQREPPAPNLLLRHHDVEEMTRLMPPKSHYLVPAGVALIVIATGFAYFPALHGGFLMDDDILLTNNALIKSPSGVYQFWFTTEPADYWPMTNTSFWLEWRLWG